MPEITVHGRGAVVAGAQAETPSAASVIQNHRLPAAKGEKIEAALRALEPLEYLINRDCSGELPSTRTPAEALDELQQVYRRIPSMERLNAYHVILSNGLNERPDELVRRIIVGVLIDAFPMRVPEGASTYVDMLILCLDQCGLPDNENPYGNVPPYISNAVLAAAVFDIVRSYTFRPSIGDVVKECRDRRALLGVQLARIPRLQAFHNAVEEYRVREDKSDA